MWIDAIFYNNFLEKELLAATVIPIYQYDGVSYFAFNNPFLMQRILKKEMSNLSLYWVSQDEIKNFFYRVFLQQDSPELLLIDCINKSLNRDASDLHFCQEEHGYQLKIRCFGELRDLCFLPAKSANPVIQLLKFRSNMDNSLFAKAQDGQLNDLIKKLDCRVSSIPSRFGEDFACRFFLKEEESIHTKLLDDLGFLSIILDKLKAILQNQHGLILVTGPTGSGKSTTLYAVLRYLLSLNRGMIATLEDPIEQQIPKLRQSQVNRTAGHDFPQALKALLRQDPDIVMIGEIRDEATAKIALEAAYTGHLILSTLHCHDSHSAYQRLKTLNINTRLLKDVLLGIIAQKLVTIPSQNCHQPKGSKSQLKQVMVNDCLFYDNKGKTNHDGEAVFFHSFKMDIAAKNI